MNNKKSRLLRQQAVKIAISDGKNVKEVYNGLKTMLKVGVIKFSK